MKKLFFLSGVIATFFGFAFFVSASSPFDITFPIPGLGNCADQDSCKAYCDDSSHLQECTQFAKQHNLLSAEDEQRIQKFQELTGPGGCNNVEECRAYCEDAAHQDECFEFAEKHNLVPKEELERARTLAKEGGPGGCKGESECRAYCQASTHAEECVDFAVKHGFLNTEDATRMKKLAVLGGPGGCKGEECRTYCEDPVHQIECIQFAEENGLMTPEDAARARKFAGKTGPGGCKGEECRTFCESPENGQVCLEFAEREGLIPPEEAARARKFLSVSEQGGPGGCKGIECRDYCEDPVHQDECFAFAKGNGLLRPEDEQNFEAGRKLQKVVQESGGPGGCKNDQECRAFCTDASHVEECIAFASTQGGIPDDEARQMLRQFTEQRFVKPGEFRPHEDFRRFEEEGRARFEEFRQLEEQFRGPKGPGFKGPQFGPETFAGPGGCSSPAECIKYCTEHKDECFSFGPPGQPGAVPPEGGIPPGHDFPRIQQNLIREFRPEEIQGIPQFQNEDQRKDFFKQKFEEFRGVPSPEGFPGAPSAFPQRTPEGFLPRPGEFQGVSPEGPQGFPLDSRAAACAGEGGVWDGSTCRPPAPSGEFFPETGPLQQQIFQQTQEQTQRQIQQQQLEQQIQQQFQQLQQLQQLSPSGGSPEGGQLPLPPAPTGGSVLDAAGSLLRRFFGR